MQPARQAFTRESADSRRADLIEATAAVLAELGLAGTNVRAICAKAGVSPGLLRHYFDGIDDLVAATYAATSDRMDAIFAAAVEGAGPDPRAQLQRLVPEYGIDDGRANVDLQGGLVLTGTVPDAATRERIARRIAEDNIDAKLELRTGDDIAGDVSEILRGQGINARTRYLGNGDVEASGRFEDGAALRAASFSRAMREVKGVNRVIPVNMSENGEVARAVATPAKPARIRVAAIVRGADPHVLAGNGERYPVGSELPGIGTLVSITENSAHALRADGGLEKLAVEAAPRADESAAAPQDFSNVRGEVSTLRM
jgi:AcrR family transcriptional regulator